MHLIKKYLIACPLVLAIFLANCTEHTSYNNSNSNKEDLLLLERNWLQAEFSLDTSYISPMIHDSCLSISEEGIHYKRQYLSGMYTNISQRIKDSIFVDSFKLENEIVHQYDNTAVVTFIVHTFKKSKGIPNEKRTRFFDVWVKSKESWKLVASQGTPVKE
ncbi:MAG: nuclear transport factor 2 family protein [Ferruginibacter sp.]